MPRLKIRSDVGNTIRAKRKDAHLSQKELAARIGVAQTTLASWETGARTVSTYYLGKLAEALSIPLSVFVNEQISEDIANALTDISAISADLCAEYTTTINAVERYTKRGIEQAIEEIPDSYFIDAIVKAYKQLGRSDKYLLYKFAKSLADS